MLTPLFVASQTIGLPEDVTLSDSSTGSDAAITQRRVYFQLKDGSYLVPAGTTTDYIEWDYSDATIDVEDLLTSDKAILITVQWLNVSNVVLYTKTILYVFTLFNKTFFYSLTQFQAANISVLQDTNYFANKAKLWTYIVSAEQAVSLGSDIAGAQNAIDAATQMIDNESKYF
jgi:hypothetical protein